MPRALQAAQKLEREQGVKVELIDLRCLNPFDWDTIAASVSKTNRALVAYEDTLSWGYGAEIAARIADKLFDKLDAPVRRVAAKDVFVAYQPILEDAILPQPNDLFLAMRNWRNTEEKPANDLHGFPRIKRKDFCFIREDPRNTAAACLTLYSPNSML